MAEWKEAQEFYRYRRDTLNNISKQPGIDNYAEHCRKALDLGWLEKYDSVLDVGCGKKALERALEVAGFKGAYFGVDAFPCDDKTLSYKIEEMPVLVEKEFDVVFAFAVLDNVEDLAAALAKINRLADRSIIILTGVGIPPDACHTTEISLEAMDASLPDFIRDFTEWLHPKVVLIYYKAK